MLAKKEKRNIARVTGAQRNNGVLGNTKGKGKNEQFWKTRKQGP